MFLLLVLFGDIVFGSSSVGSYCFFFVSTGVLLFLFVLLVFSFLIFGFALTASAFRGFDSFSWRSIGLDSVFSGVTVFYCLFFFPGFY